MVQPHYKLDPTNVSRRPLQGVPGRLNPQNEIRYADRVCCNSPSDILVRSRIPLHLLSHHLLFLILLLRGHLV